MNNYDTTYGYADTEGSEECYSSNAVTPSHLPEVSILGVHTATCIRISARSDGGPMDYKSYFFRFSKRLMTVLWAMGFWHHLLGRFRLVHMAESSLVSSRPSCYTKNHGGLCLVRPFVGSTPKVLNHMNHAADLSHSPFIIAFWTRLVIPGSGMSGLQCCGSNAGAMPFTS